MNDPTKKRPWFQYHLSTAVVLMFVAAGLLWLNVRGGAEYGSLSQHDGYQYLGWPAPLFVRAITITGGKHDEPASERPFRVDQHDYVFISNSEWQFHWLNILALDVISNVGLLILTGMSLEMWIRFRERMS